MNERQRFVVTIAVAALLTGGLVALVVLDRNEIQTHEEHISRLDEQIRTADIEIRQTRGREDQVLIYRAVENRELAVLPTRQKIADFHSNLSLFLSTAGVRFRELPESSAVESELAKGIYVTRTQVSCESDAASLLKLVNMLENDPRLVAVKGLRIVAGDRDMKQPDATVLHEAELTLETYFYNPAEGAAHDLVPIPGAERRLEEPTIQEAIASFQPERPDTYVLRPSASRRDPFVDPRQVVTREDPEALARAFTDQEPIVIDLENRARDLSEKEEQSKAFGDLGDVFRKAKLDVEIEMALNEVIGRLEQLEQAKSITIAALGQRVGEVRTRVDALRGRRPSRELVVSRALAEQTRDTVRVPFERGDLNEVMTLTAQWETFLRGRPVEPDAQKTVDEIRGLRTKAKTRLDFQAKNIRVTGTIFQEKDEHRSVALINGQMRRQGESIDDKKEIVVQRILRDGVDFAYGTEIIRIERTSGLDLDEKSHAGRPKPKPSGASAKVADRSRGASSGK